MVADWADRDLNINLYRPGPDAARDAALVAELRHWADRAAAGTLPPAPTPPCEVRYRVHGQWRDGFVAQVWLTNTGDATIDGWQAGWWFEDGQELSRAWGVDASQDGPLVTADNARWNARLRPGTSLTFGLLGTRDGANPVPEVFTLNGEVCGTG
jgi:endoglucanase